MTVAELKKSSKQITDEMNKVETSGFTSKMQTVITQVKQKIDQFKKTSNTNLNVNTDDSSKQVTQL